MLNGIHPVIVFRFKGTLPKVSSENYLTRKRDTFGDLLTEFGLPIPVYLDPRVTGICVEDDTKSIDIETVPESVDDKITFNQKPINAITNISLVARKDSVALSVLFSFSEQILSKLINQQYSIDYFNGPIIVMGGLLRSLSTSQGPDDNLIRVNIQISKGEVKKPTDPNTTVPNIRASIPRVG